MSPSLSASNVPADAAPHLICLCCCSSVLLTRIHLAHQEPLVLESLDVIKARRALGGRRFVCRVWVTARGTICLAAVLQCLAIPPGKGQVATKHGWQGSFAC